MATVVIDPGNGGTTAVGGSSANNAIGPAGTLEKTLTLDVGRRVRDVLAGQGHTVLMTRNADNNLGLAARAHVARDNHAAAFVSIHFNASVPHNAQGTETWIHNSHSTASNRLATRVQASTQDATGLNDRGVKAGGFGVINPSSHWSGTAACLVEISFMDRADEENEAAEHPISGRHRGRDRPRHHSLSRPRTRGRACHRHDGRRSAGRFAGL